MSTIDSAYWAWLDQVHKNNGCNRYVVSPMEAFAAGVSYGMGRSGARRMEVGSS